MFVRLVVATLRLRIRARQIDKHNNVVNHTSNARTTRQRMLSYRERDRRRSIRSRARRSTIALQQSNIASPAQRLHDYYTEFGGKTHTKMIVDSNRRRLASASAMHRRRLETRHTTRFVRSTVKTNERQTLPNQPTNEPTIKQQRLPRRL